MRTMSDDPIEALVIELARADRPTPAWLESRGRSGDPVTSAWNASSSPDAMLRLLAIIQSDFDMAVQTTIRESADILRREGPPSREVVELAGRSATDELDRALRVWRAALRDPARRSTLQAELAARIRLVVGRAPVLADLEPPPRRERLPSDSRSAAHLGACIADPARLRAMDAEAVRRCSRGRVVSPEEFGRMGPERGGFACERIFGTWRPRTSPMLEDDRDQHWGHIELSHECPHPVVAGALLTCLPVVPPHYRRGTLVGIAELRRESRERRAELAVLEARGELCDPVEKMLLEEGLSDPEGLTEPGIRDHPWYTVYRLLLNYERQLRRLVELGAPARVVQEQRAKRDRWSGKLVGVWRQWLDQLPANTAPAWALRALAVTVADES
jgi:hypothetical protein